MNIVRKWLLMVLILIVSSLVSVGNSIKDGLYTGEFSENGIYNVSVIVRSIDSDTKEVVYYYTYEYRISEMHTGTYVRVKKGSNGNFYGKSDQISIQIHTMDNIADFVRLKDESIDRQWNLKLKKEIPGTESKFFFEIYKDMDNKGFFNNYIM